MISVVIPAYNSEKCIENCINSVISQTHKNLELIVVDNNSTDKTPDIIKKNAGSDSRIRYIFCENTGVGHARNAGITAASGEYIFFLDSDDTLTCDTIEILYNSAKKNNLDIAACNILYKDNNTGSPMEKKHESTIAMDSEIPVLFTKMLASYVWYMVFKLFRRSILIENKIFFSDTLSVGEDLDFVIRVLEKSKAVCFIDTPLYIYNIAQNGLNLKYHENLYELKEALYNSVKKYLTHNNQSIENLYKNLTNDIFALTVNEIKSEKADFERLLGHNLTKELLNSGIFIKLSLSKKIFYICLKLKLKSALYLQAKAWIK